MANPQIVYFYLLGIGLLGCSATVNIPKIPGSLADEDDPAEEEVVIAPTNLSYSRDSYVISTLGPQLNFAATISGDSPVFQITPTLPAGLSFDTATGSISGKPTAVQAETTYTITAVNAAGEVSKEITLEVLEAYVVTSTEDTSDLTVNNICLTSSGVCTLRAAIEESNAQAGIQSILIPADTLVTLSATLVLTDGVKVIGEDSTTSIVSGGDTVRIFENDDSALMARRSFLFKRFTMQNGFKAGDRGAGISSIGGDIVIDQMVFKNNICTVCDAGGAAVGIRDNLNSMTDVFLTVKKSRFENNEGQGALAPGGGAIGFDGTELIVEDSYFLGNSTPLVGVGGAIISYEATTTILRSTFVDNISSSAGAVGIWSGTARIENCTFSLNASGLVGGALGTVGTPAVVVRNSTFSNNTAGFSGGGVVTTGGTIDLANSLFELNTVSGVPDDCGGAGISSLGGNLTDLSSGSTGCGFSLGSQDVFSLSGNLQSLANNGGYVPTLNLLSSSIAIKGGKVSECATDDARGITRPSGVCSIGAVEP
jgi:CSLREA domain-containing protein